MVTKTKILVSKKQIQERALCAKFQDKLFSLSHPFKICKIAANHNWSFAQRQNPLHPKISIHILHNVLYTFLVLLTRRFV